MAIERKNAPYAPPSNVIAIIRRFRDRNLPDKIDLQLLMDIGITKGNVHRTLAALVFLGLVHEDGSPTNAFHSIQISTDDEYATIFEGLVRTAYRDVFQVVDPGRDDQSIIDNHFRRYQPTSQRSRMVTLFLALCREAGIPTLDVPRERAIRGKTRPRASLQQSFMKPRGANTATNAESQEAVSTVISVAAPSVTGLKHSYIAALIEQVRQAGAQGKEVDANLLERIEKLIAELENDARTSLVEDGEEDS